MNRQSIALVGIVSSLVLTGGSAWAQSGEYADPAPRGGLATLTPASDAEMPTAEARAKRKWMMSVQSNTGYWHVFTGLWTPLTAERTGYWGATNASYPRVGDLYWGQVEVFNFGSPTSSDGSTMVKTEVALPRKTRMVVDRSRKNRQIRCFWFRPENLTEGEFTGKKWAGNTCPKKGQAGGIHGWQFLPSTNRGLWQVPRHYGIAIVFPIVSGAPLKGLADVPRSQCIVGSVFAAGGGTPDGRVWDAPRPGEECPLPQYHGTDRPVIVSPGANSAPRIGNVRPADGARLHDRTPRIRATVTDRQTNLAKRHIRFYVDGKRIARFAYNKSTNRLDHQAKRLSYGSHKLRIVVRDGGGRTAVRVTGFRIVR